jgi:hypothetical protein
MSKIEESASWTKPILCTERKLAIHPVIVLLQDADEIGHAALVALAVLIAQ